MNPTELPEQLQAFYHDGYQLGKKAAKEVHRETAFLEQIGIMYQAIDALIDSLLAMAKRQQVPVDCHKGCAWCCHQAVFANSYEVHYLGDYLKKNFSLTEQQQITRRASGKNLHTNAMSEQEVLSYKSPCPLLIDGACSAYQARPMACRIYLSMNVATCREFYEHPDHPDNFPALFDFPLQAGKIMNEGFIAALQEAGILVTEFRLEEGLETILTQGSNL